LFTAGVGNHLCLGGWRDIIICGDVCSVFLLCSTFWWTL